MRNKGIAREAAGKFRFGKILARGVPALQEGINIVKEIGADGTVKVRKVRK